MRARAPGKVVLSGAYAVLEGAPALVAAVDRYAIADSARPAAFVTPEVRAALGEGFAPWFDASALREGEHKLGLGSSAAILVASLAALALDADPTLEAGELARRVFPRALAAHARAQGGGSGIDVAASAFGGVLRATRTASGLDVRPVSLPAGVVIRVLSLGRGASTPELVARVRALRERDPALHARCLSAQALASEQAARAIDAGDAAAFIAALAAQTEALTELGRAAGASIVTPEITALRAAAAAQGAAILPSGAGGGDVALWVSSSPEVGVPEPTTLTPVSLTLGAPGVHALPPGPSGAEGGDLL